MELILIMLGFIILILMYYKGYSQAKVDQKENYEDFLVKNYQSKPLYKKKVIIIIENFDNLKNLLTLIKCILLQNVKVNSIILISETSIKHPLIHNTCIVNKVGGLSMLLKESSNDSILLYIFPESFKAFFNPNFLKETLDSKIKINGIVIVETDKVKVDINKLYKK